MLARRWTSHIPIRIQQEPAAFRILPNEASNSRAPTNIKTPTVLSWGFFLPVAYRCRVFARTFAETCGLRPSVTLATSERISLSPGHSSPQSPSPEIPISPQGVKLMALQINSLRADESSSCFSALVGDGNSWLRGNQSLTVFFVLGS